MATKSIRITKEMARQAAEEMAAKVYKEKIKTCRDKLDSIIENYFLERIPAPVLACTKEFSDYFFPSRRVCVAVYNEERGYYTGSIYGNVSFDVPYGATQLDLPRNEYDKVLKVYKEVDSVEDASRKFEKEMFNALVALKTTKAVAEQLPEALEYLKIPESTALPVPIYSTLRTLLRNAKQ